MGTEFCTSDYTTVFLYSIYDGSGYLIGMPYGGYASCDDDYASEVLGEEEATKRHVNGQWFEVPIRFPNSSPFLDLISNVNCMDVKFGVDIKSFDEETLKEIEKRRSYVAQIRSAMSNVYDYRYAYILDFIRADLANRGYGSDVKKFMEDKESLKGFVNDERSYGIDEVAKHLIACLNDVVEGRIWRDEKDGSILKNGRDIASHEIEGIKKWMEKYEQNNEAVIKM